MPDGPLCEAGDQATEVGMTLSVVELMAYRAVRYCLCGGDD